MPAASTVLERLERWTAAEDADRGVALFRRIFALLWVVYDVIDLAGGMTERARVWFPHPREPNLVVVQCVAVAGGLLLVAGRFVWLGGMTAAIARIVESLVFFPLNDFFFVSVVDLWLAHSDGGPFARGRRPRWVRDVLLAQLAWVYFATALLKLNPDWLSGGHLYVRTQYLIAGHGWPYPAFLKRAFGSLPFDAVLARIGVTMEGALAVVLFLRRPYWLGVALVLAVHGFGAAMTNVWFFSASMIAAVVCLLPRR